MNKSNILKMVALFVLLALAVQSVFAIGISPSRKYIDYAPGLKIQVPISIINAEQKDMRVLIYAQGDLAQYITLKETLITMSKNESQKEFTLNLKLPMDMEQAGSIQAQVFALEFPSQEEAGESAKIITAKTAVASQIIVRVPYPGKYAEASLSVDESEVG